VQSGTHTVEIVINDGEFEIKETIEVVVSAKPDLVIDEVEVTKGGEKYDILEEGDVVQIISYVRNLGRTEANNVNIQCSVDGVLIGQYTITTIAPGGLGVSTCDTQLDYESNNLEIMIEVDSTTEILETNEENNVMTIFIEVKSLKSSENSGIDKDLITIISSLAIVMIALVILQIGPKGVKREFEKIK
jgi:subtilase family serine protease